MAVNSTLNSQILQELRLQKQVWYLIQTVIFQLTLIRSMFCLNKQTILSQVKLE